MDVHVGGAVARIQMHVDIGVELAGEFEDPADLAVLVGIVVGRRADDPGTALQRLHQQFVRALVVGQALLREDAQLDVDRPGIVAAQFLQRVEAAHLDPAVQLDMGPHPRGAVLDAVLQRRCWRAGRRLPR